MSTSFDSFMMLASVLGPIIIASGGAPFLIEWLKSALGGVSGVPALILAVVVEAVVAFVLAVAAGQVTPSVLSDPFLLIAILVGTRWGSEKVYKVLSSNS